MNTYDNKLAFGNSRNIKASESDRRHQEKTQDGRNVGHGEPGDGDHGPFSPGARLQNSHCGGMVTQLNESTVLNDLRGERRLLVYLGIRSNDPCGQELHFDCLKAI